MKIANRITQTFMTETPEECTESALGIEYELEYPELPASVLLA